jgi:AcrR family transcriptional regulator
VPRLWRDTIDAHRRDVRDAIVDATAQLVDRHGMLSVTMSQIAEATGIGRATLYKYFPDVESILLAWHERSVRSHLDHLSRVREQGRDPWSRLQAVLEAYALIDFQHHRFDPRRASPEDHHGHHGRLTDPGLVATLHQGGHAARAENELRAVVSELIADAARTGQVRDDVAPDELAAYCLHALAAANSMPSKAAVHRLVGVTLAGLTPPSSGHPDQGRQDC